MSLTVAILAKDEEQMIGRVIDNVRFADEILVVDGGSRDATVRIAADAGVRVIERPFDDFARQRNFCLEQASGEWVLFVDADERVTPELADEVRDLLARGPEADAYAVPRRSMALGRWLAWHPGGDDAPVRLLRRARCRWSGQVHEVVEGAARVGRLSGTLLHLTHRSVHEVVDKIDRYSDYEAADLVARGARPPSARAILLSFPKALWSLWRSGLRREGVEGALEAVLLAFNRTLVLAKVWERTRGEALEETYRRVDRELPAPGRRADTRAGDGRG